MVEQIARTAKQIGAIIQRQRRRANLTQNELGVETSLRQATISKLEAGETNVRLGTLLDIIIALGLEIVIRPRTKAFSRDIEDLFRWLGGERIYR